ncbi:MAG: AzlD domain-containing protein [Candidatus Improbicoccus pseudotrichonymphae]|uniref:AzlD domain-containing protein n=1 Tax=Candidatus Improbicoccus pseudotrichonymphae TaxID=3033792 RepID=A0AA48IAS5_9FIRM|nr:MAG: AzlD domain-containing protein [Candidatus Improbicoccus pseudotrichonymphae]
MVSDAIVFQLSLAIGFLGYLIKMIPIVFCKKPIKNVFISSFLKYIPFAVLTSMVVPEVLNSTSSTISAFIGAILSITLSFLGQGLLTVSLAATAAVFVAETFLGL